MKQNKYETPDMEIVVFELGDIIITSSYDDRETEEVTHYNP